MVNIELRKKNYTFRPLRRNTPTLILGPIITHLVCIAEELEVF